MSVKAHGYNWCECSTLNVTLSNQKERTCQYKTEYNHLYPTMVRTIRWIYRICIYINIIYNIFGGGTCITTLKSVKSLGFTVPHVIQPWL